MKIRKRLLRFYDLRLFSKKMLIKKGVILDYKHQVVAILGEIKFPKSV